jgi:hypothetical protein
MLNIFFVVISCDTLTVALLSMYWEGWNEGSYCLIPSKLLITQDNRLLIWFVKNRNLHLNHIVKHMFTQIVKGEKNTHYSKNYEKLLSLKSKNVIVLNMIHLMVHNNNTFGKTEFSV